jgi:hypothetical protein
MARIRTIKPEIFSSEDFTALGLATRLTFIGLWTYVDDYGRGKADPRLIKAAIWPLDDDVPASVVAKSLDEMELHGMVCRYRAEGRDYLHVVNFGRHQKVGHPTDSKIPECARQIHGVGDSASAFEQVRGTSGAVPEDSGNIHEPSGNVHPGTGNREQGTGNREQGVGTALARPDRADVERICEHLAERIESNGAKRPAVTEKWREAARLLLDRDQRTEQQIHAAIDWATNDEFWRANVLSMPKLREKYEQLRLQATRGAPGTKPSTTDAKVAETLARAERYEREGRR